jgi:hypothetical protein
VTTVLLIVLVILAANAAGGVVVLCVFVWRLKQLAEDLEDRVCSLERRLRDDGIQRQIPLGADE